MAGFDNHLYYAWPMTRLVAEPSRRGRPSAASAARLREEAPGARIETIRLGHGIVLAIEEAGGAGPVRASGTASRRLRCVFGCFGGLTPEKRLPQILGAFAATRAV